MVTMELGKTPSWGTRREEEGLQTELKGFQCSEVPRGGDVGKETEKKQPMK